MITKTKNLSSNSAGKRIICSSHLQHLLNKTKFYFRLRIEDVSLIIKFARIKNKFQKTFILKRLFCVGLACLIACSLEAQFLKDGKIFLNEDGSNYFKFTLIGQVWLRHTELNTGSTVNGFAKAAINDIGIRRARIQAYGQIADRVFVYSQFGMNNFNYLSDRKTGFFIHDILGEYEVVRKHLSLGTGLTAWNGLTRFSAPSVGTILGIDGPLFEQNTNDVTDQFLRKLSVYAKGKLGKLDYRMVVSSPMAVQKSVGYSPLLTKYSTFSAMPAKMQTHGYFQYQFLDQEANTTAYATGTYLGTKRVFNIGAGFQYQPDAMWHSANGNDTLHTPMKNFAADVYYDAPVNSQSGTAISLYAAYTYSDYGPNFSRNGGAMNPANGNTNPGILNGAGNAFPMFGSGNIGYAQVGYKLKNNLVGKTTLMPYLSLQYAKYHRLKQNMSFWDGGINWLLKGQNAKLTLAYQDRPVYQLAPNADKAELLERKGSVILQYQVFLN